MGPREADFFGKVVRQEQEQVAIAAGIQERLVGKFALLIAESGRRTRVWRRRRARSRVGNGEVEV